MSIIDFFRKNEQVPMQDVKSVTVVFNLVDHASLLSASLYALLRETLDGVSVRLIDIRDPLVDETDQYVWIGLGDWAAIQAYYQQIAVGSTVEETQAHKTYLNRIRQRSEFIATDSNEFLLETTLARVDQGNPTFPDVDLCHRFSVMSETFMTPEIDIEGLEWYHRVLGLAYRLYQGHSVKLTDFHQCLPGSEQAQQDFLQAQKAVIRTANMKMREVHAAGRHMHLLTALDSEIYGLLRRVRLSKKEWLHVSMGSYGVVTSASVPVHLDVKSYGGHVLYLGPKHMPVEAYGKTTVTRISR